VGIAAFCTGGSFAGMAGCPSEIKAAPCSHLTLPDKKLLKFSMESSIVLTRAGKYLLKHQNRPVPSPDRRSSKWHK
jgi:hypothetical protein